MPYTTPVFASPVVNGLPNNLMPWTNPANAQDAPNGTFASRAYTIVLQVSDGLDFTFPPISIPGGAAPLGLRFVATARWQSIGTPSFTLEVLRAAASVGIPTAVVISNVFTDYPMGDPANLFGFSAVDIAAGLNCQLIGTCTTLGTAPTLRIDAMSLSVFYQTGRNRRRSWRRRTRHYGS